MARRKNGSLCACPKRAKPTAQSSAREKQLTFAAGGPNGPPAFAAERLLPRRLCYLGDIYLEFHRHSLLGIRLRLRIGSTGNVASRRAAQAPFQPRDEGLGKTRHGTR